MNPVATPDDVTQRSRTVIPDPEEYSDTLTMNPVATPDDVTQHSRTVIPDPEEYSENPQEACNQIALQAGLSLQTTGSEALEDTLSAWCSVRTK
jgi:hypothetical protein